MSIDTLEIARELEAAGLERKLAEAHAGVLRKAIEGEAASKSDLDNVALRIESRIDREIARIDGRLNLLAWMLGANLAATLAVL
jgi:hypothetical protein